MKGMGRNPFGGCRGGFSPYGPRGLPLGSSSGYGAPPWRYGPRPPGFGPRLPSYGHPALSYHHGGVRFPWNHVKGGRPTGLGGLGGYGNIRCQPSRPNYIRHPTLGSSYFDDDDDEDDFDDYDDPFDNDDEYDFYDSYEDEDDEYEDDYYLDSRRYRPRRGRF